MPQMPTAYLSGRLRSFGYAIRGLKVLLQSQHNARIHALATILVATAGALLRISLTEWALVALAIVCVWAAEALNTAIEFVVDLVSPEHQPIAAKAKDVAAAAVLIAAIGALVIGGLVFGPYALRMLAQ